MKSRKTIKKALAFFGVSSVLVGATCATSIILKNTDTKPVVSQKSQEIKYYSIYNNRRLQTLKDQSIINAIASYEMNPDASNVAQSFQFVKRTGMSATASLVREIQSKIKYFDINNPNIVRDLPKEAITINNPSLDVYNISIDLALVNGTIGYVNANGNYIQTSNRIWFNATCIDESQVVYNSGYSMMSSSSIGYIVGGVLGAVALLLITILIIKKKTSNKYIE